MVVTADIPPDYSAALGANIHRQEIHCIIKNDRDLSYFDLYQGTGGSIAPARASNTPATGSNIQIKKASQNKLEISLNEICNAFGLNREELATICHVNSRKTLYNWIDGKTTPRKPAMKRVFDLLSAADSWKHAGFSGDRDQLQQPVLDGQSLFDILNQEKIDSELILFVGARLNIMSPSKGTISDPFA
jgi:hypothetical protein